MVLHEKSKGKALFGSEVFEITIPTHYWRHYFLKDITNEHAAVLLQYNYERFTENLFCFIDSRLILREEGNISQRLSITKSIIEFCEKFGITEREVKLETLIKDYQRSRKNGKTVGTTYVRKKTQTSSISQQPL